MAPKQDFVTWIGAELQRRNWSQAELARRGGFSTGALSRIMNRERMPGVEVCQAIARAFKMRDTDVMKIAGLADSTAPDDQTPSMRELISRFTTLSDDDQESVLRMVRALDEMEQAEKRRALKPKPRTG